MALTLDGTAAMPYMGGSTSGAGLGIGGGVLGGLLAGGVGGALAGGLLGNRGGWGNGWNGNGGPATTAVATDIVLNPAFNSLQNQVAGLAGQISHNSLANTIEHEVDEVTHGVDRLDSQLTSGQAALADQISSFATASAGMNFTTLQSINGLGNQITAAQNQAALQQLNSFNNLNTTTLQGFNGEAMQIQNATNQIIAQGNAAAMTAAECCCDIKSLIVSDGNLTRTLINDLNVQNLRDQLNAANNQISNFEQNQFIINNLRGSVVV